MSSFTAPLDVRLLDNGRDWMVLREFTYCAGEEGSDEAYTVPRGFVTDFASVPRCLWWLIPPTGRYGKAVVLHDNLYRFLTVSRLRADQLMLEACGVLNVPRWKARIIYRGVRMGGWIPYNRYLREKRSQAA